MAQISTLYLDRLPDYIPFTVQCTDATGLKTSPTVDNLAIYEENGADAAELVAADLVGNFDPVQLPTDAGKTGLWGILVAKTNFAADTFYICVWEVTVDGVTTAKVEQYFFMNTSEVKADVSNLDAAVSSRAPEAGGNVAAILADTAEMQPKLPNNYIMGSADGTNKSDDIDNILVDTITITGKLPAGDIAGETEATSNKDEVLLGQSVLTNVIQRLAGETVYNIAAVAVPARLVEVGMLDTIDMAISTTQVLHVELTYNSNKNVVSKDYTVV